MTRQMQNFTIACAIAGGILFGSASLAGEWKPGGSVDDQVKMMDSNGDGKVSAEEHAAGADKMFQMLDANKDGNVTAEEMDAAHAASGHQADGMPSADKIKVIDSNGDGMLSASEHATGSLSMFSKSDADRDGTLTADEIKAAHASMMNKKEGQ